MVGRGKRRGRNRLIKYGLPYLQNGNRYEGSCKGECLDNQQNLDCPICQAKRHLQSDEWTTIGYLHHVRQLYRNQTPSGNANGACVLTPVLLDWEAALRIWKYPEEDWQQLVEDTMMLFYVVTEQVRAEKIDGEIEMPTLDEWLEKLNG